MSDDYASEDFASDDEFVRPSGLSIVEVALPAIALGAAFVLGLLLIAFLS